MKCNILSNPGVLKRGYSFENMTTFPGSTASSAGKKLSQFSDQINTLEEPETTKFRTCHHLVPPCNQANIKSGVFTN